MSNNQTVEKKAYTPQEFAQALGVHVNTVYNYIYGKKLRVVKIGRKWYIPKDELDRILREGMIL